MSSYFLSNLRRISEDFGVSKNDILSYIDPENDDYDPTFPKPFSRENNLYWDQDEMAEWEDFQSKLKDLSDRKIILILK